MIIDHLHYIDTHKAENENAAFKSVIKGIRDLALASGVPVIVVAHLRKRDRGRRVLVPDGEDFHGTSDLVKIATKAVLLARADHVDTGSSHVVGTFIRADKDRRAGRSNLIALAGYNLRTGTYEDGYRLGRLSIAGDDWQPLEGDLPTWATRCCR